MASGKEKASTAASENPLQTASEETSSDKEWEAEWEAEYEKGAKNPCLPIYDDDDDDEDAVEALIPPRKGSAADVFGSNGVISVLFETPSGFVILAYDAAKLTKPEAWKHIWADFVNVPKPKAIVWLRAFQTFEDKSRAINATTISPELTTMIQEYVLNRQVLAVGKQDYKNIIQNCLGITCLYNPLVKELMWGLKIQMRRLVPQENSEPTNEYRFPMSEGMGFLLNHHKLEVDLNMMVTERIIEMAGVVYECDRCVDKHNDFLRCAAKHLMKISSVDTGDWDLLKLATALKMICYPEEKNSAAQQLFPKQQLKRLMKDAPQYKNKIFKTPCLEACNKIYSASKKRLEAAQVLVRLVKQAKMAHEAKQSGEAANS